MKVVELHFSTDAKLEAADGITITKGLKNVLVNVVNLGLNEKAPNLRILWRALDDIEASGEEEVLKLGKAEFDLVKQSWEAHLPATNIYYKWLQAVDNILESVKEVKA